MRTAFKIPLCNILLTYSSVFGLNALALSEGNPVVIGLGKNHFTIGNFYLRTTEQPGKFS
jgi:hypothetical protein